jgi:hypothetical protein
MGWTGGTKDCRDSELKPILSSTWVQDTELAPLDKTTGKSVTLKVETVGFT